MDELNDDDDDEKNVQCTTTCTEVVRGGRPLTAALQRTSAPSSCVAALNVAVPRSVTLRTTRRPRRPPTVTHHDSARSSRLTGSPDTTGGSSWTVSAGGGWPPTAIHRSSPGLPSMKTRLDGAVQKLSVSMNDVTFSSLLISSKSTFAEHTETYKKLRQRREKARPA